MILFVGCHVVEPVEPVPKATCESACANLEKQGCAPPDCRARCEQQNSHKDAFGGRIVVVNVDCLAAADCESAKECR